MNPKKRRIVILARIGFIALVAHLASCSGVRRKVTIGEAVWDNHVTTYAASGSEASRAFPPRLRALLANRGFQGHLEMRPGGLVLYMAGLRPITEHYQRQLDVQRANTSMETSVSKRKYYDRERYIYNDLTRRTGAIVISSSRGSEFSYELEEMANGVFTEEMLLALTSDRADQDRDGMVSTDELRMHLAQAVPKRTEDQQHPTVDRDNLDARFGFPVVMEAAGIVERQVLPAVEMDAPEKPVAGRETPPQNVVRPRGCGCDVAGGNEGWELGMAGAALLTLAGIERRLRHRVRGF